MRSDENHAKQSKQKKASIWNTALQYGVIILCAVLMAFNYQLFIVKNNFAPAGLNGIATMIQYKTGFSIGYFSLIINIPLCLLAFFFLDRNYAARTLVYSFAYSFSFLLIQRIGFEQFQYNAHNENAIFPVMISGFISGTLYYFLFSNSASTGGTDVLSKFISEQKPEMNFFWVTFLLNFVVAVASFFVYAKEGVNGEIEYNYLPVCLCVLYCFLASFIGDYFLKGTKKAWKFTVITSHPDEIAKHIHRELKHGCTKVSSVGSYSGQEKTVLICVINKHQLLDFKDILAAYPDTFSFSEVVNDTYGNFKRIK